MKTVVLTKGGAGYRSRIFLTLLIGAILTSLAIWWMHAGPVLFLTACQRHSEHFTWLCFHAVGGTLMLVFGSANQKFAFGIYRH